MGDLLSEEERQGKEISLGRIREALPATPAVRMFLDALPPLAEPDPSARWGTSAALEGVEARRVAVAGLAGALPSLVEALERRLRTHLETSVQVLEHLAEERVPEAVDLLVRWGSDELREGRIEDARAVAVSATALAERSRDRLRTLDAHLLSARVHRALGRLRQAEVDYETVLRVALAAKDGERALTAAVGLGNLAVDRGTWSEAERRYDRAETFLDALDGPRAERWHLALNRSLVARERKDLERSARLLDEAERVAEALDDQGAVPILENARGQLLDASGQPARAVAAFRRALGAAVASDARVTIGVNLAQALLGAGALLEAGLEARRAEDAAIRAGTMARLGEVYRVMGAIHSAGGSPEALVHFERALSLVQELGLPRVERARILEAYARSESARGEPESASALAAEAKSIRQTLEREEG